jgi:hypothetical protein
MKTEYADLIEHYAHGGEKLSLAIRGLTRDDMLQSPPSDNPKLGKWTIQQAVVHLMDSDLIGVDRMKRIIAEDNPTIIGYDENKFVQRLFYHEQSANDAVTILSLNRKNFAEVLRRLPHEAFARTGTHNERGKVVLASEIEHYAAHLERHLRFIHAKRAAMGKEMW